MHHIPLERPKHLKLLSRLRKYAPHLDLASANYRECISEGDKGTRPDFDRPRPTTTTAYRGPLEVERRVQQCFSARFTHSASRAADSCSGGNSVIRSFLSNGIARVSSRRTPCSALCSLQVSSRLCPARIRSLAVSSTRPLTEGYPTQIVPRTRATRFITVFNTLNSHHLAPISFPVSTTI
jgi:hypothetical protein